MYYTAANATFSPIGTYEYTGTELTLRPEGGTAKIVSYEITKSLLILEKEKGAGRADLTGSRVLRLWVECGKTQMAKKVILLTLTKMVNFLKPALRKTAQGNTEGGFLRLISAVVVRRLAVVLSRSQERSQDGGK